MYLLCDNSAPNVAAQKSQRSCWLRKTSSRFAQVRMIVSEGRRVEKARKCQLSPTIVPDDSEVMAKGWWAWVVPGWLEKQGVENWVAVLSEESFHRVVSAAESATSLSIQNVPSGTLLHFVKALRGTVRGSV